MSPGIRHLTLAVLAGAGLWVQAMAATEESGPSRPAWEDPQNPIRQLFGGRRLDLWSLRPIHPPALPGGAGSQGANPIDAFLGVAQETRGIRPLPEADRRTLIRRVTFDLTGLPPTPAEVEAFVVDRSPGAYERLVDRRLGSAAYGEHQARWWMDVIRYSDSNGFDWDEYRTQAWRFRDYLIRSFNADKPFDQLVREHLAGDELVPGAPRTEAERDALLGTGYLRMGPHDNAAPLFNEQDRSRAELMADLTETTGSAFLGLTFSCCRCHDHKYDPLSQADHYRLRAFFEPVKFADDLPLDLAPEQDAIRAHNAAVDAGLQPVEAERDALLEQVRERLRAPRRATLTAEEKALLERPDTGLSEEEKSRREGLKRKVNPSEKEVKAGLDATEKEQHQRLEERIAALKGRRRPFTTGLVMRDGGDRSAVTRVLFQGNHQAPRNAVEPGYPSVLDPRPARIHPPPRTDSSGRRLALAEWIVARDNPLTARVFVNRVWQALFGTGLVATPNDFGLAGARPTHPELLDWLAADFRDGGWSVKRLHRRLVTSAAYRRASTADPQMAGAVEAARLDPGNTLGWRQNPRRLSAEQLRDALLAVSGQLQARPGGQPVWPELPAEVLQANPAFLDDNETRTKGWYPSPPAARTVRSVYLVQKRTVRVPFMETFDLPENSTSCARRIESTVAPQALSLLNGPDGVAAARALAKGLESEAGLAASPLVTAGFRRVLQRAPTPVEADASARFVRQEGLVAFARVLLNLNEFVYLD